MSNLTSFSSLEISGLRRFIMVRIFSSEVKRGVSIPVPSVTYSSRREDSRSFVSSF